MSSDNSKPLIACRDVTKVYGSGNAEVHALRGVNLDVYPGEITMLVGPSGCGKTTLLSIVAGILRPTKGSVLAMGTELTRLSSWRRTAFRRQNVGFVFQQFNLLPALTAAENAAVPLVIQGYSRWAALAAAKELLGKMGMGDRVNNLPGQLSGGQQQRVAIARALVHHPHLLVCDEPTSALDAKTGHTILELLRNIAIEGDRAVIIVTHDSRIFEFADTLARMDDGHIEALERDHKGEQALIAQDVALPRQSSLQIGSLMISKLLNILTKFGLPIVAIALIGFAVRYMSQAEKRMPILPPPIQPAANPFVNAVAGAGMVEPETENISIGTPLPGIVVEVAVRVGQRVEAGEPLFRIDDRDKRAALAVRQAMLADAQAALDRLEAMPRPEELPAAEARVQEAKADWENWEQQSDRREKLLPQHATSEEEYLGRKKAAEQARERYNRAIADDKLLKAGAWEPEKQVARSAVQREKAEVQQAQTEVERLTVRALVDGEVLQVNVRPGEYVGAYTGTGPALIVLGATKQLNVRVDIDEYDIPRFVTDAPARATLKGQGKEFFPLRFVRIEPYVIPKKSLTGDNTERVDTRVLQVIYAVDGPSNSKLFVGQQVDVFVDASAPEVASKPRLE